MKIINSILVCFLLFVGEQVNAQGIRFTEGSFSEVKALAKQENKPIMLYFKMAGGSCEQLEKDVSTNVELAEFYNEHFVCYAIDAADNNTDMFMGYEVHIVPMVILLDSKKTERYRIVHRIKPDILLRLGKAVTGEAPTLEEMFQACKLKEFDLVKAQQLLFDAPYFITMMPRDEGERWMKKLKDIYATYVEKNGAENMFNSVDFNIVRNFNKTPADKDPLVEYLVANFERCKEKVPEKYLVEYLFDAQNNLILSMARSGNKEYVKALARVTGDMKYVYSYVESKIGADTLLRYQAGGLFLLFGNKNQDAYVRLKNEYFDLLGARLSAEDLYNAINELMGATEGKLTEEAATVCAAWVDVVLGQKDISDAVRLQALIAKGDCCASVKDFGNARICYKDAYMLALQVQDKRMQQYAKQKMADLDA